MRYERRRGESYISVSDETIYTWRHGQAMGELTWPGIELRTGREQRKPRDWKKTSGAKSVGMRSIKDWAAEVAACPRS